MSHLLVDHLYVFSTEGGVDWTLANRHLTCYLYTVCVIHEYFFMKFISIQYSLFHYQHDMKPHGSLDSGSLRKPINILLKNVCEFNFVFDCLVSNVGTGIPHSTSEAPGQYPGLAIENTA